MVQQPETTFLQWGLASSQSIVKVYMVLQFYLTSTVFAQIVQDDGSGGGICRRAEGFVGVAPGQSAVFYDGDAVLCGGIICPA